MNGGTCSRILNGFVCQCPIGFTGPTCSQRIDPCNNTVCLNGGICTSVQGVFDFTCVCMPGYNGRFCQNLVDNCISYPCKNGGVCINSFNLYQCRCLAGYTGVK